MVIKLVLTGNALSRPATNKCRCVCPSKKSRVRDSLPEDGNSYFPPALTELLQLFVCAHKCVPVLAESTVA